jgi:tetratricopeptide (TPR) repeat protein
MLPRTANQARFRTAWRPLVAASALSVSLAHGHDAAQADAPWSNAGPVSQDVTPPWVATVKASMALGAAQLAVARARAAVRNHPGSLPALRLLGVSLANASDTRALEQFLTALDATTPGTDDEIRLAVAREQLARGRYQDALRHLEAIENRQVEPAALRLVAYIRERQGRFDLARRALLGLLRREPEDADALRQMARLLLDDGHPQAAFAYLHKARAISPHDSRIDRTEGRAFMLAGDAEAARVRYSALVTGSTARVHFDLGLIALYQRRYADASRQLRGVIGTRLPGLDPVPAMVLAEIGQGHRDAASLLLAEMPRDDPLTSLLAAALDLADGETRRGLAHYRSASNLFIDLAGTAIDPSMLLGTDLAASAFDLAHRQLYYQLGYFRLAASAPRRTTQPPCPAEILVMARAQWKSRRDDRALALYSRLRQSHPTLIAPVVEQGDIAAYHGNTETAIRTYEEAARLRPGLPALHLRLGELYLDLGQPDAAMTRFRNAATISPHLPAPLLRMAMLLSDMPGRRDEAHELLARALTMTPGAAQILKASARLHLEDGNLERAFELFSAAMLHSPSADAEILHGLGETLMQLQQPAAAMSSFEHALDLGIDYPQRRDTQRWIEQLSSKG